MKNLKSRDHSEVLRVNERITLECILEKQGETMLIGFIWLRIETSGKSCEASVSIKDIILD